MKNEIKLKLLNKGIIDGYQYFIITRGRMCYAYVALPPDNPLIGVSARILPIEFSQGISFVGYGKKIKLNILPKDEWLIGWDYAHSTDYYKYYSSREINGKPEIIWVEKHIIYNIQEMISLLNKLSNFVHKIIIIKNR